MSGKLSKCLYIHSYTHLITSSALNECLLVHNFQNNCSTECHCVTQKSIEVWLHNKCHKIYLSGPFGIFCLYVILNISYLRAQTMETSSLLTDSRLFLAHWLYISAVSTFLNIRASYWSASSGFRLLREIPAGAINIIYLHTLILVSFSELM